MNEFEGFPKFWIEARKIYTLHEALTVFHMFSNPYEVLKRRMYALRQKDS
jgi:hypothetical protein